jgi:hypothetical protein
MHFGWDLPRLWFWQLVISLPILIWGIGYPEITRRLWNRLRRKYPQIPPSGEVE